MFSTILRTKVAVKTFLQPIFTHREMHSASVSHICHTLRVCDVVLDAIFQAVSPPTVSSFDRGKVLQEVSSTSRKLFFEI